MAIKQKAKTKTDAPDVLKPVKLTDLQIKARGSRSRYKALFSTAASMPIGSGLPLPLKGNDPEVLRARIAAALQRVPERKGDGWRLRVSITVDSKGQPNGLVLGKFAVGKKK